MTYRTTRPRGILRLAGEIDDFMSWMLYGYESWLVATLKAVALFLFMYFLLFYIPNYVYYALTLYVLDLSSEVGFLAANLVGGGNFTALIVMAVWAQAARGRRGFFWSLIRYLILAQLLLTLLVLIPFMAFNLAGGSLIPFQVVTSAECDTLWCEIGKYRALLFGMVTAGIGAVTFVYLWFEYRRVTRREALAAAETAAALTSGA